jgi:GntR family transcriptional regulator
MALPFPIAIRPGDPVYEQIVYATKKAVAQGLLKPGDRFPSVRVVSQELGVNPNTVQKAFAELATLGILEVHSGQGCFVAPHAPVVKGDGLRKLEPLLESLVVEARGLGLTESDLRKALSTAWQRLRKE